MLAMPASCTHLLPESPGSRAKALTTVGAISIALVIIAAIGTSTGVIPAGVNATFFSFGLLGTCLFCQTLPLCLRYVLESLERSVNLHSTRQSIGRSNLITCLQKMLVNQGGDWSEATYHLLRTGTFIRREESGECHDQLKIGDTVLADNWPDELSSPNQLCKPCLLKQKIDSGENVRGTTDFTTIVQQLRMRYEQDMLNPFFLLVEHSLDQVLDNPEFSFDAVEDMDKICCLALFNLLRNATREGDTLILQGYRLDFSGDLPLNALTTFGNQQEPELIYKETLVAYEAIHEADNPLDIQQRFLTEEGQHSPFNPGIDALKRVAASIIRDKYYANFVTHRSDARQIITGNRVLYMDKIRERFNLGDTWWAPSGSCYLASALMVAMPDIIVASADVKRNHLMRSREEIADEMLRLGWDYYRDFFEDERSFFETVRDIRDMRTWFSDENRTMEAVAFFLKRPIHLFIPSANSFQMDLRGNLIPSRIYNDESRNAPIYILAGAHCQPLTPITPFAAD